MNNLKKLYAHSFLKKSTTIHRYNYMQIKNETGHALCTGLAVCGGQLMASKISERQVVLSSGALFLGFAAHGCVMGPEE